MRSLLAVEGDGTSSMLARICVLAASELGVTGAGVTLLDRADRTDAQPRLARAGDAAAARLEDLQLTVGEGPGWSAVTVGAPVLVPDLGVADSRWPAFAPGARALGVAAVFAFPLTLGAIGLGSLDCYRASAGLLEPDQVTDGLLLADLAFEAVLAQISGGESGDLSWITDLHTEVHQASGIVSDQQGIAIQAALLRIRGHAYAHDLPVTVVAREIVASRLVLDAEQ
ncbi:ANTAR domain-containing protein [Amycolatopsis acidiphila]|uniref:ANTAR domain-containing protein n=1 Tax=Amycolatopsis acidiphila TaxID=715473 RepID=A0A557ZYS6_9PSEU|nr:ANTAR domain-containing protein [Amycolatopsis acidiphila]TVT17163.1 ANTAR domain-containing protein [Amycolatopsis acidiphila]UIJ63077.1 ANTAR domain-containing protein [Amycolatopsis acidiphila]GHG66001.1 GAF domain-containing protein [Amycolatopsis acidiphila]